jgi:predicted AAA+ superfamily ATPase
LGGLKSGHGLQKSIIGNNKFFNFSIVNNTNLLHAGRMKNLLRAIIADQAESAASWSAAAPIVPRTLPDWFLTTSEVVILSGVRRCGKSVLLQQARRQLPERDFFLNFDDDRLVRFTGGNFQTLQEVFLEMFGEQKTYYFDEIQNVAGWERFVRRLHETGNKVFVTGSNATMLSRELGTRLTGRYLRHELYPFSFREFLALRDGGPPEAVKIPTATKARAAMRARFAEYLRDGGFPAYLREGNTEILQTLAESILYRDIMVRNRLTSEQEIRDLLFHLASNVAKLTSHNALAKTIGVKNASTVKKYLLFLRDSYLVFQVNKYDRSARKQMRNEKKIYFADNALARKLGFAYSENTGCLLENLVFLEHQRRGEKVFYHRGQKECDFLVQAGARIVAAEQVCAGFENAKTKEREIAGLAEAMDTHHLDTGVIITLDDEEEIFLGKKKLRIIPAWKWLLTVSGENNAPPARRTVRGQ